MNTPMLWRLVGAFINVTLLSRLAHMLLRRWIADPYRRAYIVLVSVALIDFAGIWTMYRDLVASLYITLFYYVPLLIMWFLKDILDAARTKARASGSGE
ncbi:MAG TPA: hypothetical protein VHC46_00720 [Thermodesulfobacteriota bacterium]|nr:hypothetical protein [Thermodesulfobacteriota bacterium]